MSLAEPILIAPAEAELAAATAANLHARFRATTVCPAFIQSGIWDNRRAEQATLVQEVADVCLRP